MTQLLGLHQTAQTIVGRSGHVTCNEEVIIILDKEEKWFERGVKELGGDLGTCRTAIPQQEKGLRFLL